MKKDTKKLDLIFGAVANAHRRSIIENLSLHPASISSLATKESLSLPAIHRHIGVLEDAGLLQRKKVAQTHFLALRREGLKEIQHYLEQFNAYWGNDSETLENYLQKLQQGETRKE